MNPVKVRLAGKAVGLLLPGLQAAARSVVSVQGEWQAANPGASYAEVQLQADGALLGVLARWHELGVLSGEQLQRLCAAQLSCPAVLPTWAVEAARLGGQRPTLLPQTVPQLQPVRRDRVPSPWVQELGTVWLLWLGVFSIGISATALVGSRWQAIAPAGQVLLLLASTWGLWGLGQFLGRGARLPLTTQALQTAALGLLPLNVWGAQGLGAPPWVMLLTLGTMVLLLGRSGQPRWQQVALACGSHWLWGWSPGVALHGGTVAAVVGNSWLGAIAALSLVMRGAWALPLADLGWVLAGLGVWLAYRQWYRGAALWLVGTLLLMLSTGKPLAATLAIGLAAGLRWVRQRRPRDLVFPFYWNLAIAAAGARLLPPSWAMASQAWAQAVFGIPGVVVQVSLGLLAYILAVAVGIGWAYRRGGRGLAAVLVKLTLGLWGLGLSIVWNVPALRLAYLVVGAIAGLVWIGWRVPAWPTVIYSVQGLCWGLFLTLWQMVSPRPDWAAVLVLGTLLAWVGAWRGPAAWRLGFWQSGAIAAAGSLILLWVASAQTPGLYWLAIPTALTFLGTRSDFVARSAAVRLGAIAALLVQGLLWSAPDTRLFGFGVAWLLMLVLARQGVSAWIVFATVGCGLGFVAAGLAFRPQESLVAQAIWGGNGLVGSTWILLGLTQWLQYRREQQVPTLNLPLNRAYAQAFDLWAAAIAGGLLLGQTLLAVLLWQGSDLARSLFLGWLPATALVFGGTWYRQRLAAIAWGDVILAGCLEIGATGAVVLSGGSLIHLAIANAALGWLGRVVRQQTEHPSRVLNWVPLIYSTLSLGLRWGEFNALTGLLTANAALMVSGIARRESRHRGWAYLAIVASSIAAYETVFGSLAGGDGLPGDGLVIGAGIGLSLAAGYRFGTRWVVPYFRLSAAETQGIAYLHAGLTVLCLALNAVFPPSRLLAYGGLAIALLLLAALWVERRGYGVAGGALATVFYGVHFALRDPWPTYWYGWGAVAVTAVALLLSVLPWEEWGWLGQPWRRGAVIWPLTAIALTAFSLHPWAWIALAGLYGGLAWYRWEIRLTYPAIALAYVGLWQGLPPSDLTDFYRGAGGILWLLYLSHGEFWPRQREPRHRLRSLGGMVVALWSIALGFTAEGWALPWLVGALGTIAGLSLQVRAYLLLGTVTGFLTAIGQTIQWVSAYSFLLWLIGLVAGFLFIAIAANLEKHRERWPELVSAWQTLWGTWD